MAGKKRVTKHTIRESNKRDSSPKWDGCESWTGEQFTRYFHEAQQYYSLEKTGKELKSKVIDWMSRNGYDKSTIAAFKKTKDWRTNTSTGGIAANLLKGMPAVHPGFNHGKDTSEWLRNQIALIIEEGANDIDTENEEAAPATTPVLNIQERIHDHAASMCEDIEGAIDSFIIDPNSFNPGDYKIANMLRSKGAKGAQARYVKGFYESNYNDLMELASGNADENLREGYKHLPRKNVKKLIEFYESIQTACDQIIAEAKVLKKPRKKRVKSAEDQVKKIKFKLSDDKLGITSTPAAQIIGAQGVVVYNTKNRKIGYYTASGPAGLLVKGTSIIEYSSKSVQKTLRKPAEQIKEFKEQNTQKRFETWFA